MKRMEDDMKIKLSMRLKLYWLYAKLFVFNPPYSAIKYMIKKITNYISFITRSSVVFILSYIITYEVLAAALLRKSNKSVKLLQELFDFNTEIEKIINKLTFEPLPEIKPEEQEKLAAEAEPVKPSWLKK